MPTRFTARITAVSYTHLDDRRGDGALRRRFELMQFKTADPGMTGRIFFKLALTHNYFILPLLSFIESLSGISLQTPNQKAIRPEFSGLPLLSLIHI